MNCRSYGICADCIMDTTDPKITFDELGLCDYCNNFSMNILPNWHTDEHGEAELMKVAAKIRKDGEVKWTPLSRQ
jgi:NMD protein affecting ribosome stability and mRNA decay